jgi:hypothetical protein
MTSPIASPQNIFAVERMSMDGHPPSWLSWFAVALPVAFAGNLVCWGLILAVYRPGQKIKEVRGGVVLPRRRGGPRRGRASTAAPSGSRLETAPACPNTHPLFSRPQVRPLKPPEDPLSPTQVGGAGGGTG